MCNILKVYSAFVDVVAHLVSGVYLILIYIAYRHRVCEIFHIYGGIFLVLSACDNNYLIQKPHVVSCVDHKMAMHEIELYYKKNHIFLHNAIFLNMILSVCPIFFTCTFFVFSVIHNSVFTWFVRWVFFLNIVINWHPYYGLRSA